MNNRGLQGLVGRACGHLYTAVHDSIAPREHVIKDCYTSEVFSMQTSDKYHTCMDTFAGILSSLPPVTETSTRERKCSFATRVRTGMFSHTCVSTPRRVLIGYCIP